MGLQANFKLERVRVQPEVIAEWYRSACEGTHVALVRYSSYPGGVLVTLGVNHHYDDLFKSEVAKVNAQVEAWVAAAAGATAWEVRQVDLLAGELFASAVSMLEYLPNLPRGVEENKLTDTLVHHLSGRVAHRRWTISPQSRGGRADGGAMGVTRGGVGSRDLVISEEGLPIAIFEALVAAGMGKSIDDHHRKLTAPDGYNPAGLRIVAMAVYFRGTDLDMFWKSLATRVIELEGVEPTRLEPDPRSTSSIRLAVLRRSNGGELILMALDVGAVERS